MTLNRSSYLIAVLALGPAGVGALRLATGYHLATDVLQFDARDLHARLMPLAEPATRPSARPFVLTGIAIGVVVGATILGPTLVQTETIAEGFARSIGVVSGALIGAGIGHLVYVVLHPPPSDDPP